MQMTKHSHCLKRHRNSIGREEEVVEKEKQRKKKEKKKKRKRGRHTRHCR